MDRRVTHLNGLPHHPEFPHLHVNRPKSYHVPKNLINQGRGVGVWSVSIILINMVLIGDRDRLMHFVITKTSMGAFVVRSS